MLLATLAALSLSPSPPQPLAPPVQADVLWERASHTGGDERTGALLVMSNGHSVVASSGPFDSPDFTHWLRGYDRNGALEWERGIDSIPTQTPNSGGFFELVESADGGFFSLLFNGNDVLLHKRNASGVRLWTAPPAFHVVASPDGGCMVWSSVTGLRTRVRRYDADGAPVWSRLVQGEARTAESDSFGNLYLFGANEFENPTETPIMAGRVRLDGTVEMSVCTDFSCPGDTYNGFYSDVTTWSPPFSGIDPIDFEIDGRGHTAMLTFEGSGRWSLHSFDRIGGRTWSYDFVGPAGQDNVTTLGGGEDGPFYVAGTDGVGRAIFTLRRFDANGQLVFRTESTFPNEFVHSIHGVEPGPGGVTVTHLITQEIFDRRAVVLVHDAAGVEIGRYRTGAAVPQTYPNFFTRTHLAVDASGRAIVAHPRIQSGTTADIASTLVALSIEGEVGARYCDPAVPNSSGAPAELAAYGSASATANQLTLRASSLPALAATMMITGQNSTSITLGGLSQGVLCVTTNAGRYVRPGELQTSTAAGVASLVLDLTDIPSTSGVATAMSGETRYFQAWFRDANPMPTSNFTSATAVTFL